MDQLRLSLIQTDLAWEDKETNLQNIYLLLRQLKGQTDLVVLPEMFTTGFTMNSRELSEPISSNTISTLTHWSEEFGFAIAGSFINFENKTCYNRGFFVTPEKKSYFYDKRHLFRMGREPEHFSAGKDRLIVTYQGWNICLMVCYDLRFPVWCRNRNNEYDLLVFVANWPESRRKVWDCLLQARAIENMSYVCGVNRIGCDGYELSYNGGSMVISPKGIIMGAAPDNLESLTTITLSLDELTAFRAKFPVWKDADDFELK